MGETGFLHQTISLDDVERRYVTYIPSGYRPEQKWPAILFLHGRGESGTDGLHPLWYGVARAIVRRCDEWPFVVFFPQKPDADLLWTGAVPLLEAILDASEQKFNIDRNQCFLTGLSQGGHGTIQLATKLSWSFAALAPVCGWAESPEIAAEEIGGTPLWAFHGDLDETIPVSKSVELVDAIQKRGGNARLTRYPDLGHDSWHRAYQEECLAEWFLSHSL